MPVFLWASQLAGVDNSNELHNKINEMQNNEHKSIVADMLSDWKGWWPDILEQPGENTELGEPYPYFVFYSLPSIVTIVKSVLRQLCLSENVK